MSNLERNLILPSECHLDVRM